MTARRIIGRRALAAGIWSEYSDPSLSFSSTYLYSPINLYVFDLCFRREWGSSGDLLGNGIVFVAVILMG